MKFNFLMTGILSLGAVSVSARPMSGGMDGGGGNAVVCRDQAGQVTSAELLDLFEAKNLFGRKILTPSGSDGYLEYALKVAKMIDAGGAGVDQTIIRTTRNGSGEIETINVGILPANIKTWIHDETLNISRNMRLLQPGTDLKPIDDSEHFILPRNCKIQQAAIYRDDLQRLFVVRDIWDKLDNANKAALLNHEALYKTLRLRGEVSSERTRLVIGYVFSGTSLVDVIEGIPKEVLFCNSREEAPLYRFAIYQSSTHPKFAVIQFLELNGETVLTKTTLALDIEVTPLITKTPSYENQSSTTAYNLKDMIRDKSLGFAWRVEQNQSGNISYSLGLHSGAITDSIFKQMSCHRIGFSYENGQSRGWYL